MKLVRTRLVAFRVCGVWNWPASRRFTCLAAGERLPARTHMVLEQSPRVHGLRIPGSPGWGLVGRADGPVLKAVLSNTITGNRYGTVYYRVTLRNAAERILLTSRKVSLTWRRPGSGA